MNAVEIEKAISHLAEQPFDADNFLYAFLEAFGNKTTTIQPLRSGNSNQSDLTRCAEDILLTREAHFPATIADPYDPDAMPADLRAAHERNDETLEPIFLGRRFKNDTERLEKLIELYTEMTAKAPAKKGGNHE